MKEKNRYWSLCQRYFLTGLAVLLPVALTLFIVGYLAVWLEMSIGKPVSVGIAAAVNWIAGQLWTRPEELVLEPKIIPGVGLVIALLLVMITGGVVSTIMGRRIMSKVDRLMTRFPVVNQLYPAAKQIVNFMFGEKKFEAKTVVAIEYPRKDLWAIGFVTGLSFREFRELDGDEYVNVFVPFSPLPATGWLAIAKRGELREMDLTFEEAMKFLFSAGVVIPDRQAIAIDAATAKPFYAGNGGEEQDERRRRNPDQAQ